MHPAKAGSELLIHYSGKAGFFIHYSRYGIGRASAC
jgi:hypothetical protein